GHGLENQGRFGCGFFRRCASRSRARQVHRFCLWIWIEHERNTHRLWHPLKIVMLTPGSLGFAAPVHLAPALIPIKAVVVIESEAEEAAGDFLACAAGKRVQGNRWVSTPIKNVLSRLRILVEVETDLAVIPLARILSRGSTFF